jgi:hypothetical protein
LVEGLLSNLIKFVNNAGPTTCRFLRRPLDVAFVHARQRFHP